MRPANKLTYVITSSMRLRNSRSSPPYMHTCFCSSPRLLLLQWIVDCLRAVGALWPVSVTGQSYWEREKHSPENTDKFPLWPAGYRAQTQCRLQQPFICADSLSPSPWESAQPQFWLSNKAQKYHLHIYYMLSTKTRRLLFCLSAAEKYWLHVHH